MGGTSNSNANAAGDKQEGQEPKEPLAQARQEEIKQEPNPAASQPRANNSVNNPKLEIHKEGIDIGEEESKCCFVVDIKAGVFIIGCIVILNAVAQLGYSLDLFRLYNYTGYAYYGIVSICLTLPGIYGGVLFGLYFHAWHQGIDSEKEKAEKTPLACMLQMASIIGMSLFSVFFYYWESFAWDFVRLVYCLIECLFFFYFVGICKRWIKLSYQ